MGVTNIYILTYLLSSMKTLNVMFTDKEYKALRAAKILIYEGQNWNYCIRNIFNRVAKEVKEDGNDTRNMRRV